MKSGPARRVTPTVVLVGVITHAHIAALLEFVEISDKRIGLNDVDPSRTGRLEASVEVFERLFQLSGLGFHPRRRLLAAVARGGA
jgi:hypothetical protein